MKRALILILMAMLFATLNPLRINLVEGTELPAADCYALVVCGSEGGSFRNDTEYMYHVLSVDWYKFYVEHGQTIQVSMTPPSGVNFNLELYDPGGNFRTGSYLGAGQTDSVYQSADTSGYWRAKIYIQSGQGQYSFSVTIGTPGGGEGCPILYIYNGSEYVCEGLLDIHNTEGIDLITNHTLLIIPQRVYGTYLFQLVEHSYTHSYIDQAKLYAVLENGMVIQLPLIWAWHSEYDNVLPQLLFSDDWRTETIGAVHNNGTSQTITLRFLAPPPNIKATAYIFQIEGYNPEFKQ